MTKTGKTVAVLIALIIAAIVLALAFDGDTETATEDTADEIEEVDQSQENEDVVTGDEDDVAAVTVTYTDSGFEPSTVRVEEGQVVTWVNDSSSAMWVASAVHPTHEALPGFDQLESVGVDGVYTYTFGEVGEWRFHNHVNAQHTGTVIVE